VFCIGSAFQCGATTLNHIFIGRAVGGVGVGALRYVVFVIHHFCDADYRTACFHHSTWPKSALLKSEGRSWHSNSSQSCWGWYSDSGQGSSLVHVYLPYLFSELLSLRLTVPSSASWRIPLGVQLLPGIILGLGCFFLPPSPRLLVLHGRYGDALESLSRLRQRPPGDVLLQVLFLLTHHFGSMDLLTEFFRFP